jgi:hypothetical protein
MNLVGKLLVVLILVMSVAFMAFSVAVYSTHKNWMEVITNPNTGYKVKLDQAKVELEKETAKLEVAKKEAVDQKQLADQQIAKLNTKRDTLDGDVKTLAAQVAELKTETAKQLAALTTAQTTLDEKMKQVDTLRKDIATAQTERDDNGTKYKDLQSEFNNASNDLTLLKEANTRLVGQMAHAKILLERQGVNPEASVDGTPPKVDGVILAIGRDNLVEISLGSDDGIQRGNTLEVFRATKYKGRVEVVQTSPDKSVAKIIPGFQQAKIERDDRVATRFN